MPFTRSLSSCHERTMTPWRGSSFTSSSKEPAASGRPLTLGAEGGEKVFKETEREREKQRDPVPVSKWEFLSVGTCERMHLAKEPRLRG